MQAIWQVHFQNKNWVCCAHQEPDSDMLKCSQETISGTSKLFQYTNTKNYLLNQVAHMHQTQYPMQKMVGQKSTKLRRTSCHIVTLTSLFWQLVSVVH